MRISWLLVVALVAGCGGETDLEPDDLRDCGSRKQCDELCSGGAPDSTDFSVMCDAHNDIGVPGIDGETVTDLSCSVETYGQRRGCCVIGGPIGSVGEVRFFECLE